MTRDQGLDRGRSKAAIGAVQGWRDHGELPFPDFDSDFTDKHRDTLDYPPPGSPETSKKE